MVNSEGTIQNYWRDMQLFLQISMVFLKMSINFLQLCCRRLNMILLYFSYTYICMWDGLLHPKDFRKKAKKCTVICGNWCPKIQEMQIWKKKFKMAQKISYSLPYLLNYFGYHSLVKTLILFSFANSCLVSFWLKPQLCGTLQQKT